MSGIVRLKELEPILNEIKRAILKVKPLITKEEWESNVRPTAEQLLGGIVSAYLDAHLPSYEIMETLATEEAQREISMNEEERDE